MRNHLDARLNELGELGFADEFADVRAMWDYAEYLRADQTTAGDLRATESTLAGRLARREITKEEAALEAVAAEQRNSGNSSYGRVLKQAQGSAFTLAWAAFVARGDGIIVDVLRPAVTAWLAEFAKVAEKLPDDVDNPDKAMGAPKTAEAWSRLANIAARFELVHQLAQRLRQDAVVSWAPSVPTLSTAEYRYRHPERVDGKGKHPVIVLRDAIAGGAEPGIYTGNETAGFEAERQAQVDAEHQARRNADKVPRRVWV